MNAIGHFSSCHNIHLCYEILLMFSFLFTREISDNLGQPVNCVSMSNDGNCFLAGCLDSTLRLLDRCVCNVLGKVTTESKFLQEQASYFFLVTGPQVNCYKNIKDTLIRLVCRCLNLILALHIF